MDLSRRLVAEVIGTFLAVCGGTGQK